MLTVVKNPYQSFLDTEIANRRYDGEYYHLIAKDTLSFDCRQFNLPEENLTVNQQPVVKRYLAGKDLIHVIKEKPESSRIWMGLDLDHRRLNQREVTLRLLMQQFVDRFYAGAKVRFVSQRDGDHMASTAQVRGILSPEDGAYLIKLLDKSLDRLIRAGLSVRSQEFTGTMETTIYGQGKQAWAGPHLFNTAEIYRYELGDFHMEDDVLIFSYTLL